MSTPQRPSNAPPDDLPERATSDEDRTLLSGQARSVGSGVLGGWSQAVLGGSLGEENGAEGEVRAELRARACALKVLP
ncbi:MAG TPA: hypothetical protein VH374_08970 [Polyangia bacterium]|jgi:hypothetical protein|nr:hypothetical protein [Polyangia bacterium]